MEYGKPVSSRTRRFDLLIERDAAPFDELAVHPPTLAFKVKAQATEGFRLGASIEALPSFLLHKQEMVFVAIVTAGIGGLETFLFVTLGSGLHHSEPAHGSLRGCLTLLAGRLGTGGRGGSRGRGQAETQKEQDGALHCRILRAILPKYYAASCHDGQAASRFAHASTPANVKDCMCVDWRFLRRDQNKLIAALDSFR